MREAIKNAFGIKLDGFVESLNSYVATADGQWTVKGFI